MKVAPIRIIKVKRPLWRQRNMFGARIKIMLDEQLVDPPVDKIIYVLVMNDVTTCCLITCIRKRNFQNSDKCVISPCVMA